MCWGVCVFSATHRLLWVLLAAGGVAEDPLQVLVGHDQAGLQQVLGGGYGDGGGGGRAGDGVGG